MVHGTAAASTTHHTGSKVRVVGVMSKMAIIRFVLKEPAILIKIILIIIISKSCPVGSVDTYRRHDTATASTTHVSGGKVGVVIILRGPSAIIRISVQFHAVVDIFLVILLGPCSCPSGSVGTIHRRARFRFGVCVANIARSSA
jgi:hypothetical protein